MHKHMLRRLTESVVPIFTKKTSAFKTLCDLSRGHVDCCRVMFVTTQRREMHDEIPDYHTRCQHVLWVCTNVHAFKGLYAVKRLHSYPLIAPVCV